MKTFLRSLSLILLGFTLGLGGTAQAQVVIQDLFNQASSGGITSLAGQAPNTNMPGGTWVTQGGGFTAENSATGFLGSYSLTGAPGSPVPYAFVNGDRATVSLAGYNSGTLTISAYMNNQSGGGGSLGFSNVDAATGGFVFNGLNIDNAGDVSATFNGVTGANVAFGGTYDPSSLSLLSFTVNIATGNITSISFQGSTVDYSSLLGGGTFGSSATAFVALEGSTATRFADLNVTQTSVTAPEPSTEALLIGSGAMLVLVARRRLGVA